MGAIQADFVNYKRIATRKAVQLIFEIPEEQIMQALEALGRPGTIDGGNWCGIAPLDLKAAEPPKQSEPSEQGRYDFWHNPETRGAE